MRQITEISEDPKQRLTIITEDNKSFELKLVYSDQQQGWFYSIIFGNLSINGIRLVSGANILRAYKNIIPFGIGILTEDRSEPVLIDDFSSERVKMFLLNEQEVKNVESDFYNN